MSIMMRLKKGLWLLALAVCVASGARGADPVATVSGTSVTISNEDSSLTADNATISDMSTYCGKNFTIPAVTGLDSGTILKITSVSIAKSKTASSYTPKIKLAGVPSATAVVTSGGFTGVEADKITYSFADVDCIVKVGTATTIRFLTEEGEDSTGAFAFHLRQNAYQFIDSIVWSSKVPVVEIQAEILGSDGLLNSATTGFAPTTGAKYVLCGASGWLSTSVASTSEIVLNDGSYGFGFKIDNGNSTTATSNTNGSQWSKLSGTGTLTTDAGQNSGVNGVLQIYDVSDFTGAIQTGFATGPKMSIMLRNSSETLPDTLYNLVVAKNLASIYVSAGKTGANAVTIAAGKTWKASKLVNYGELTINGTFDGLVENHGTLTVNGTINGSLLDYGTTTMNGTVTEQVRLSGASVATFSPAVKEGDSIVLIGEESVATAGTMPVTFPTGVDGADVSATIIRRDGGYCTGTWDANSNAYTYNSTIETAICGESTVFDWTFTNVTAYAKSVSGLGYSADVTPYTFNNSLADKTTGLYLKHRPYTTGNFLTSELSAAMTLVVVGQMPSVANTTFLSFGSNTTVNNVPNKGIFFATTSNENELLVAWNSGSTVNPITTMKVPNGSASRHVYAITKQDVTIDDVAKSQFVVYLDGTPWKKLVVDKLDITVGGVQVGADFGGTIRNVYSAVDTTDTGVVNAIRLFGSVLSEATIKKFSEPEEYPYNSPYGNSVRTFTVDGNWVETGSTPWANTPNGGAETAAGAPLAGSSLTVTADNANGVTVSVNLDSDTTYEALTLNGDPIAFEFAEGKSGVIKATGAITIGAETTIKAGALEVGGATTILDNGKAKLIFDYSDYDASGVMVANPQTTPLVLASMDEQEAGKVTCNLPTTPHRVYSFGYANGGYNLSITAKQATLTRSGVSVDVDTFAEIFADAENYAVGDTIGINEDVTIANLAVEKDITLDLGANNLTITGAITGEGAITLTGAGTLVVPVGTTFPNLTSASTKIAVSGTVAKGTTLFTVGSGTYSPTTVYSAALESDVHYTLNTETGAYVVGKTYYWIGTGTGTSDTNHIEIDRANNWSLSSGGSQGYDCPLAFDTAVFDANSSGRFVKITSSLPCNIKVQANTTLHARDGGTWEIGNITDSELTIADDTKLYVQADGGGASAPGIHIYNKIIGGRSAEFYPQCTKGNSRNINFHGDMSAFYGNVVVTLSTAAQYVKIASTDAINNVNARWSISETGSVASKSNSTVYTPFGVNEATYKFGALKANIGQSYNGSWNSANYKVVLEIGENIDEDSFIGGEWTEYGKSPRGRHQDYGGTVMWKAASATFTQKARNAYNVTLMGGGNVYVATDTAESSTTTAFIPTQINFTDNGGYLTIDDDNAAIAENILAAVNTKTAGVGINLATTEAQTIAAAGLAGADIKKKGAAELTITGIATVGTVTVAEGAVILPAGVTPTLGTGTAIDASYTGEGVKIVSASSLAATVSEDGGSAMGYATLAGAIAAATASEATAVTVTLQVASDAAVTLDAKTTLVETSTAAYSGTLSGSGTFAVATIRASEMYFSDWTGTVVLPALTANQAYNFNFYGVSGSTVRLSGGFSTGWLADTAVAPAIEIPAGQTFTLGAFSPSFANAFAALKGNGTFAITATANQDNDLANVATWGAGLDYSAYFRIGDVSGFYGTLATTSDVGIALGASKPAKNTAGGKFYVTGEVSIGQLNIPTGNTFDLFGGGALTMENTIEACDLELWGTLTITDGTLSVGAAGNAKWLKAYNNAVVNLNGGELDICRITASDANGYTVNFNGGTLKSYGDGWRNECLLGGADADNGSATITLNVLAGGATIDTAIDTAIAPVMTGAGGLTKKGAGTLTLSAEPTFTGAITVEAGKVLVPDTAEIACGAATAVKASGTAGYNEYYHAAAKIGSTYYTTVEETFTTLMSDRSTVVEVLDSAFTVDAETEATLTQQGIIWDSTARTLAWAAVNNAGTLYPSVAAAINGGVTDITIFKNVTEDVTLPAGVTIRPGTFNNVTYTLTGTVTAGDGAALVEANGVYTAKAVSTSETWIGATAGAAWNVAANWSEGFVPTAATPIAFSAGEYKVYVTDGAACASMDVAGTVTFAQENDDPENNKEVVVYGNVTGSGAVKISRGGIRNSSGGGITFAPAFEVLLTTKTNGEWTDSWIAGSPITFNNTVTVNGRMVTWDSKHVFKGNIAINGNGNLASWGAQGFQFDGITITSESGCTGYIYLGATAAGSISGTGFTLAGATQIDCGDVIVEGVTTAAKYSITAPITLADGAVLTLIPAPGEEEGDSTVSEIVAANNAKYVTVDTATTGRAVYSVAAKPVATVTVGENVTMSGVTDGDAFVPGATIEITVTPDTYYTASVTVTGATYANGVVTVGTTDFTVSVTATRNQVTLTVPMAANATATVTAGGVEYTTGSVTIDEGAEVSVVWTAATGYGIVSGGTQTIQNFTSSSEFATPEVEEKTASFSNVSFVYSGYNKATVYAKVSYTGEQPAFTMTVGNATYTGDYSATDPRLQGLNLASGLATTEGWVTFSDVAVGDAGSALSYTLSTTGATSSYAASTYVGDVTSGWIATSASDTTGGEWTTEPTVTDGKLDVSDNTFTATTASAGEVVVINFNACFTEINTEDVSGGAPQAAVKIGSVNDTATFMVWDGAYGTGAFRPVAGVTPDVETEYAVVVTLNYLTRKYTVTVGSTALYYTDNEETVTEFTIGDSTATSISSIGFEGAGTLASMTGDYYTVYAAQDADGTKYKTIAAAVAAIEAGTATEPVTVLHTQSSYPTLWGVDANGVLTTTAVAKVVTPGENYDTSAFYATLQDAIDAAVASETANDYVVVLNAITDESVTLANNKSVTIDFGSQTKMAPVAPENAYKIVETAVSGSETAFTYTATDWATYTITLTAPNATVTGIENNGTVSEANPVVTFTVAAAQYYTLGDVTATPEGGEAATLTADNDTYTYTLAADTTFAVAATRDQVTLTIPTVENATASVAIDDVTQEAATSYTVDAGAKVVVTWTAATNYRIDSGATQTINPIVENTIAASPTVVMDVASFTIAVPANTIVKVDGQVYTAGTSITKTIGTQVTITYEADGAYVAGGTTTQTITVAGDTGTVAAPADYTSTAAVAQVGEAYYATLAGAVADGANATVTLLQNVTLDSRIEPNASMTIDLGGYTVTRTGTSGNGSAFDVKSGNVTIKNGAIDCTQDDTAIAANGVYAITARSGSAVTLEGLTVTVDSECGACAYPFAGATLTINSGTYSNTTTTPYRYNTAITGMAVNQPNDATQRVFINGGTFSQVDPMYGDDAQLMTNFCSEGYIAVQDSETGAWGVVEGYVITFANDDGTVLETYRVEKGDTPEYTGATPAKTATAEFTYTFKGWDAEIAAAMATATYTATYTETVNQYTLTVPTAEHASYAVTVGDVAQTGENGVYTFDYGTVAKVVYTADSTWKITANAEQTFTIEGNAQAVAPTVVRDTVDVTVPKATGFEIHVTANGTEVQGVEDGGNMVYTVTAGSNVEVAYTISGAVVTDGQLTYSYTDIGESVAIPAASAPTYVAAVAQVGAKYYATLAEAVAAATAGDTVALIADASGAGVFVAANAGKNITIDLGDHTYTCSGPAVGSTGTQNQAFHLEKGNTITIRNGTIASTSDSGVIMLVQNYANLTLDDVTLDGTNLPGTGRYVLSTNNGSTTINDTTINAKEGDIAFDACTGWGGYTSNAVAVTGNSVVNGDVEVSFYGTGDAPVLNLAGGTMTGEIKMAQGAGEATVVKADTFTQEAPADYKWVDNGDGTATLAAKVYVAQVGQAKYESLAEAVAAATAGDTVALIADASGAGVFVAANAGKNITIDLGGRTYTCSGPAVGSTGTQNQAFHLEKGNTITIRNGTISSTSDSGVIMLVQNYANLTLDDVTLDGTKLPGTGRYVLSTNNGSTTINDTTITAKEGDIAFDACTGWGGYTSNAVAVTGNSVVNGDVEVSFYGAGDAPVLNLAGGTMTGEIKMAQGAGEATVVKADAFTQEAPADYKWVDNGDGTATLAAKVYVAQVGQAKYESLEEAVAEAAAGDSVTLLADIPLAATIAIAKNLTIDLGGHNITATDCRAIWVKGGNVAITGTGTISTVVTEGTALASSSSVIRVGSNDATTSFTLGENVSVTSDYCYGVTYFGTQPQTVVIDGTVSVTGSQAALSGNGSSGLASTTLTVNGTVSATQDYAIYNPQQGVTTLNGTITGLGGIEVKAGTVNINGGTITATSATQAHSVNNNGTSTTGYAIASIGNASYAGGTGGDVVINGGTISGKAIVLKENNAENLGTVTAKTNAIVTEENLEWKETATEGVYELVVKTFTIVWKNGEETLETDEGVEYGATPEYNGATPAKDPAGGYTYEFAGWSPEIVAATANATYTAQFTEIAADRIPVAVAGLASGSTQIIAVPVQEEGATVTAASLISTDNRAAGDTLKVFDKATGRYNSWVLAETEGALVWTATTVFVADGSETSYTSPEAETVTLTPGEGVWVTVGDASKPLQLQGTYAGTTKSQIVVTKGFNLVAPPPKNAEATGFALADFGAPTNPGDRIVIPTGGAPRNCQYKTSRGGWYYAKPKADGTNEYVTEITVPAGTGFWYVTGDAEKEIEL